MRFNVAGLLKSPPGTRRRVSVDDVLDVGSDEVLVVGPIIGELSLIRDPSGVIVDGVLSTVLRVPGARCIEPVEVEVEFEVEEHFRPTVQIPGGPALEGEPDGQDDPATEIDARHTLDLTEVLRQSVLLSVPHTVRCDEGCKGLCPDCGTDLNRSDCDCEVEADPRWSELRALLEDG